MDILRLLVVDIVLVCIIAYGITNEEKLIQWEDDLWYKIKYKARKTIKNMRRRYNKWR